MGTSLNRSQTHTGRTKVSYPGDDLGFALFPPLGHLGVDLLAHLRLDLPRVPGEERQEALRPAVDDVDLVEGHRVHDLLPLLQLPFWTLHELRLEKGPREFFL